MMSAHGLLQPRACWLAGRKISTWQYKLLKRMTLDLRERIIELAAKRHRFDYRRLHIPLRRESWQVNHKTGAPDIT